MNIRILTALGLCACIAAAGAAEQKYPDRPIRMVVPQTPGGSMDTNGRALADILSREFGHNVVIDNRGGANGIIAGEMVANSLPDGYTLLIARVGAQAALPAIDPATPYKWNDFTFLSVLELNPTACVVRAEEPARSLAELVEYMKRNPGKLNYSSSGEGSLPYMATQLLFSLAGLGRDAAVNVPYKSDQDVVVAMLGGQVNFHCASTTALVNPVRSGRLRGLAVFMPERMKEFPDVPTAREQGYADLEKVVGWSALYGPPGMAPALIEKWTKIMRSVAQDQGWVDGNTKFGGVPAVRSPADTERFAREQFEVYSGLTKSLGIRP